MNTKATNKTEKWRDTVMKQSKINGVYKWALEEYCSSSRPFSESAVTKAGKKAIAEAQAETSFNIGKQYGFEIGLEQGKAEGIREAVEWVNGYSIHEMWVKNKWQPKLKEWGIDG